MTNCRYSLKARSFHLNIELEKRYTLRLSNTEELDCYNLDLRTKIKYTLVLSNIRELNIEFLVQDSLPYIL